MMNPYLIPAEDVQTEINILKSRFITSISMVTTVESARHYIETIKAKMPDANHHVYAFRIGNGNSVIEGMTDDGEPSGTSGPPSLSVLRGSGIGDIVLVTTRYFGGTKLGKGGLVRAYTESAQTALELLKTTTKASKLGVKIKTPYHLYTVIKNAINAYGGEMINEVFEEEVVLTAEMLEETNPLFVTEVANLSSGQLKVEILTGD